MNVNRISVAVTQYTFFEDKRDSSLTKTISQTCAVSFRAKDITPTFHRSEIIKRTKISLSLFDE